jgi:HlyD family secretion protein
MKLFRHKVLIGLGAAVAFATVGGWTIFRGDGDLQYRSAAVTRGDVEYSISATGSPNAVVTVQVGSQVSGNILDLNADFNTKVKKGQLVARIDPQVFQARVNQASANLDAAKAAVVNARAVVQRAQAESASASASVADSKAQVLKAKVGVQDAKLKADRRAQLFQEGIMALEDKETAQAASDTAVALQEAAQAEEQAAEEKVLSAKADVEVARTQLSASEAQVKQAAAALQQAQLDLDHTYITAPVDGTVVARHVDVGQTVAASMQAPTLFEIAQDLTKMQVDTNVSEADVGRVKVGQAATFTVDAYPGEVFRGQVSQIRQAPINVQNVITYDVVIAVPNPDLKLFPGMTANVKVLVDRHEDALKIPNAALRFRPADTVQTRSRGAAAGSARRGSAADQTVWTLDKSGKPRPVPVKFGLSDGTYTEVAAGGLHEGDQVIVAAFSSKGGSAPASPLAGGGGGRRGPGF